MTESLLPNPKVLSNLHEFFASGYFEEPEASPMLRWSRAERRHFENRKMPSYQGEFLYPCGPVHPGEEQCLMAPNYSATYYYNEDALMELLAKTTGEERETLRALQTFMRDLETKRNVLKTVHTIGGGGYTHSIPHYGRVLREGFSQYSRRIAKNLYLARQHRDAERIDFYLGLEDILAGIKCWHQRLLESLRSVPLNQPTAEARQKRLLLAYEQVPFYPARDFFEALVAYNFVYYLDGCDNPGRVDQELFPYYQSDLVKGRITHEEAVALIRCLWENCDVNHGWSAGIGGTTSSGEAAYNDLTIVCLEAIHQMRRPNLQLHVRRDMPERVWEVALDTLATGCGLPALYNEEEYLCSLREACLGIDEEDLGWHNGGGCTETMIHGCSNVGSLDAGINLPLILVQTFDEHLATAANFDELVSAYKEDVALVVREITGEVSADQEMKARLRPQPKRSLLIDDCIDKGQEFNAGGARYNWSVINVAGLANVIDSLAAVREVVFEMREKTGVEFLKVLQDNYEGEETFRQRLTQCPRFGNDDPGADKIAADISKFVFQEFLRYAPWRGGKFLSSCLMFTTYTGAGKSVAAMPDGRLAGEPLADSAGPVAGRDLKGPTATLCSCASLDQRHALGTLVVNIRLSKKLFGENGLRKKIKALIRGYFRKGGMQLQINVVDQKMLREAIESPEEYGDLIIRVGGYSEYWRNLTPELQRGMLERIEHE